MALGQTLRLGLAGLNQTPLDWRGNLRRIRRAWREARDRGVKVLCFPELTLSGYSCEDAFLHPDTGRRAFEYVKELASDCGDEVVLLGCPIWFHDELFNAVAVLNQGRIRGITLKCHLAREGIHYEPRWFRPWKVGEKTILAIDGQNVPVGTLTYEAAGLIFSLEICEDAWVKPDQRPCRLVRNAQWIFNSSASHFSRGKADIRENIVRESSANYGVGYAYANLVGCESGRAIYDGELIIAERGEIVSRSGRLYLGDFKLHAHDMVYTPGTGPVDVRLRVTSYKSGLPPLGPNHVRQAGEAFGEFAMAASLALFDYMRKSRSFGFTLSLSGGVDSATVAVLVWIMARRILNELSLEERRDKLAYWPELNLDVTEAHELVGQLLTTVYQATRNSGPVTRRAARELTTAIGAKHLELDIDHLVEGYKAVVAGAIGRDLSWRTDDIPLQNIQARVRAPGVWMLANLNRSLLLATSNRSEVAVGYATMDGDTCGGLAPIAGVEKTFLRAWLRQMEHEGLDRVPALPVLRYINQQQPTAELRPPEEVQEDEKDLMPYEALDVLENALVSRRLMPKDAFDFVFDYLGDRYSREQIYHWTRKFCRLFAVSQWKRERYAPAFHLDDSNLDPKTWARYPILSGAFEVELEELDRHYRQTA